MARKSFRTASRTETIEFDVDGEVFHCHAQIAAGVLMKFADATSGDTDTPTNGAMMIAMVREFFSAALIKDDRARFFGLLEDPDRFVDLGTLIDIATWLGTEYTARPTGSPSAPTSRETGSGDSSTDGALPTGTTFTRKETPAEVSA